MSLGPNRKVRNLERNGDTNMEKQISQETPKVERPHGAGDPIPDGGKGMDMDPHDKKVVELRDMLRQMKRDGFPVDMSGKDIVMAGREELLEAIAKAKAAHDKGERGEGGDDMGDEHKDESKDGGEQGKAEPKATPKIEIPDALKPLYELLKSGTLDEVKKMLDEVDFKPHEPQKHEISIKTPDMDAMIERDCPPHKNFPLLCKMLPHMAAFLPGPAGSGKSYGAEMFGDLMKIKNYYLQCVNTTTKQDLMGYMLPNGTYISPFGFYEAIKFGGMFTVDEADAGNPNILLAINDVTNKLLDGAAKVNRRINFPNGESVPIHKDFYMLCTANTWGQGADAQYVGRNKLDASTLSRFGFLEWDYDEAVEAKLVHHEKVRKQLWDIRKAYRSIPGEQLVVSTRHGVIASKLVTHCGVTVDKAFEMTVWAGVSPDVKSRVLAKVRK